VYHDRRDPGWLSMTCWSALSMLPDSDVIGFALGVRYGDPLGHRGATHSLTAGLAGGAVAGLAARATRRPVTRTALIATAVLASHGLLDTLTDGGLGAALLLAIRSHALLRAVAADSRRANRSRVRSRRTASWSR
jgi:membrane-bound metal-dependent hydrolase YbcI (DUF457 family)